VASTKRVPAQCDAPLHAFAAVVGPGNFGIVNMIERQVDNWLVKAVVLRERRFFGSGLLITSIAAPAGLSERSPFAVA
jgi:hypothetical protein